MSEGSTDKAQLQGLLQAALDPSTAKVASERLRLLLQQKDALQQKTVYLLLAEEVLDGEREELRQLAAVLLRRKIAKAFSCMEKAQQTEFTDSLVMRLGCAPSGTTRRALTHLLAAVLRLPQFDEVKSRQLLQLLAAPILQPQQQADEAQRFQLQVAVVEIFAAYVETAGDDQEVFAEELSHIFAEALKLASQNPAVAAPALQGLRALAEMAVDEAQQRKLCSMLPSVKSAVENAIQRNDEVATMNGLELFDDLLSNEHVLKDTELLEVLDFLMQVASNSNIEVGIRQQAMAPIHWAAKQKPRILCKGGFVPRLLDVLIIMAAEPDYAGWTVSDEPNDEEDDEELTPQRLACQTVDAIAVSLPNKHVCRPFLQRLEAYIHPSTPRTAEEDILQKRAALTCIGIMSEGCEAALRGKLKHFIPFLLPLLQHGHHMVISAAALCLGQFAEYLQPEIMMYQHQVLPLLLGQLDNQSRGVQHKACYALDVLLENMTPEDVAPVAGGIVQRLVGTLQRTPSDSVREVCLSAIRSAAVASAPDEDELESGAGLALRPFDNYAADLFILLETIIKSPTQPRGCVSVASGNVSGCSPATKARAIGVIGGLVKGLSPRCYEQQLRLLLQLVIEQIDGHNPGDGSQQEAAHEIRDEAFACLRDVSSVLKEEFLPFLEDTIVRVLASLFSGEGLVATETPGDFAIDDSDTEDDVGRSLHIRDGYLDELDSAALCLRALWENCGKHCMKYIEKTLEAIQVLKSHFHESARQQSCFLATSVLLAAHSTLALKEEQTSDFPMALHPHVSQLWQESLYPVLFSILSSDTDKETVGDAFSALGAAIEGVGAAAIFSAEQREALLAESSKVLCGKHQAQLQQDVDNDDDSRQEEEYLFEGLVVFLSAFAAAASKATAAGATEASAICNLEVFTAAYARLHPHILALASHRHSTAYAAIGVGCFAEVFREMKEAAVQYAESPAVLKAVAKGIAQQDDEDFKRNSCFCLSVIYTVGGSAPGISSKTMEFLQLLHPVFRPREDLNKSEHSTIDNAAAAVAAMILHAPSSSVPLEQLLPFFLKALPLEADKEESKGVLEACVYIATTRPDLVVRNAEQFIFACACEASYPGSAKRVGPELRQSVKKMLQQLAQSPEVLSGGALKAAGEALQQKPYARAFVADIA